MPIFGPPNIDKMKAKRDIKGLLNTLKSTKDPYIRRQVARALSELADKRSFEQFVALLRDSDTMMRELAAEALGKLQEPRAINPLILLLREEDMHFRDVAAQALEKLGWQPDLSEDAARYWIIKGEIDKCIRIGASAVEELLMLLEPGKNSIRRGTVINNIIHPELVIKALGEIKDSRAVEPLVAQIQPGEPDWLYTAVNEALAKIGVATAIQPLLVAIKTGNEKACEALSRIRDPQAVEPLIAALRDDNKEIRKAATQALGQIGDPQAVEPLIAALRDDNKEIREAATQALGEIGDPRAVDALVASLENGNQEAAFALDELKWEPEKGEAGAIYWISRAHFSLTREESFEKCVEIGTPAIKPLIEALGNSILHEMAAKTLERLGWVPDKNEAGAMYWIAKHEWNKCLETGSDAINPLITVFKDWYSSKGKTPNYKEIALELLNKIGDPRAVEPLTERLEAISNGTGAYHSDDLDIKVVEALGKIADLRAVEPLIRCLGAREGYNEEDKMKLNNAIAKALGQIGDARGAEPILKKLAPMNPNLDLHVAAEALVEMGTPIISILSEAVDKVSWGQHWASTNERPWAAIIALGKLRDTRGVEPLIEALASYPENEKELEFLIRAIIEALGEIGDKRAVAPLIAKFDNYPFQVTMALVKIGDEKAVEALANFLRGGTRRDVAEALVKMKSPKAIEPLIGVLKEPTLGWKYPSDTGAADVRKTVLHTLKAITQQDFGEDVEKWQQWLKAEREKNNKPKAA